MEKALEVMTGGAGLVMFIIKNENQERHMTADIRIEHGKQWKLILNRTGNIAIGSSTLENRVGSVNVDCEIMGGRVELLSYKSGGLLRKQEKKKLSAWSESQQGKNRTWEGGEGCRQARNKVSRVKRGSCGKVNKLIQRALHCKAKILGNP